MELSSYWPSCLQNLFEFQQIASAEQPEIDRALKDVERAHDNFYISTLSEYGCARWESILHVENYGTLEERRFRIMAKISENLPYTVRMLERILETLCGPGNYTVEVDNDAYTVKVKIGLSAKSNFNEAVEMLNKMVPANTIVDASMMYNTHEMLRKYTHNQLSAYTHKSLKEDVL